MTTGYTVHDEHVVDLFLLEAEADDTTDLKAALLELRSFAAGPPVEPSAKLAELMETGPAADLDAQRQRRHRRTAVTALAVAASMGIGAATVAAADPGFREKAQETITTVIDTLTRGHSGRTTPAPASPEAPGHAPDHPTPAPNVPGRSGKEIASPATGAGNSGHDNLPTVTPGSPPETTPAKGTESHPAGLDHQNTPNRTRPATPSTGPHS
ncbi:hypothetical protein [Arthrobacter sp. ISL-5]|uniref:hypothetical protein n=1 Tax=Arthrobacter sp. ISL-5 TaxID=2819111 RepID=UPI001BECD5E0|nr:hypothetical protein [Arthrobacter sp. ISL-5]MBT2552378.1 hypothetical protein [Arthrobacter sp. ISL-5]